MLFLWVSDTLFCFDLFCFFSRSILCVTWCGWIYVLCLHFWGKKKSSLNCDLLSLTRDSNLLTIMPLAKLSNSDDLSKFGFVCEAVKRQCCFVFLFFLVSLFPSIFFFLFFIFLAFWVLNDFQGGIYIYTHIFIYVYTFFHCSILAFSVVFQLLCSGIFLLLFLESRLGPERRKMFSHPCTVGRNTFQCRKYFPAPKLNPKL